MARRTKSRPWVCGTYGCFLQKWPLVLDPPGPADPAQIQPELGTAIDFNQDGRMDLLLHDVYGRKNNHIVLRSKADGTFEEVDTQVERPFPLGPAPKQLRSAGGSVHIADLNGDGVGDLIQCEDHGDSPEGNPSQPAWTLHLWTSGGFVTNTEPIDALAGVSCAIELRTVDVNRNAKVDLVLPRMINIGGNSEIQGKTYSSLERQTDGTWSAWDTKLPITAGSGRIIWADVNGDGLPDAIASGASDGRLRTWMNTGNGFTGTPRDSVRWDGLFPQDTYIHLATPLDFDGDGRTDLLLPMIDAASPVLPRWLILRATDGSNGFTFERINAGIPFEAQLGDAITLADPHGLRVGDVNGDGAADVVLFLGNELHIFQNRASDPDVLVGFSDGLSEHNPEEPGFIPNTSISYGHLTDAWKTNGEQANDPAKESYLYLSHADATNDCAYPRHCAVGPKRVVREYAMNDGQGGMRRFGVHYRDGRYDRRGHGFLGFGERIVTDLDTNAGTATFYDNMTAVKVGERNVYPFANQMHRQWRWAPALPNELKQNRVELAFVDMDVDVVPTNDGQTYFTLPTKHRTRRMQGTFSAGTSLETWIVGVATNENATMLRDTSVDIADFDAFGNVLGAKVSTVGVDLSYETTRLVKNDTTRWILGQLQQQTECSKAGVEERCRLHTYTTNEFGEVESESTSDKTIPGTKLVVEYDKRDEYGNIGHVRARDEFGHVRERTTVFDDESVFPSKEINALGHETILEYDHRFGILTKETDPNQLVTEWRFDSLGRETLEKRPDGSQTTTTLSRAKIDGVWRLSERKTTTGGADDITIFDSRGRPIRTFSHSPTPTGQEAQRRMQVVQYDRLNGKTAKRSVLTTEGTPDAHLLFDAYEFDSTGREIRHTTPWNATTTTAYDGFVIDSIDPLSQHTVTKTDAWGRPVSITDAKNGVTSYTYGPFNTLRTATDPGGATTTWTLDALGRPRIIEDPDRGKTTLVHDGFGELVSSTDALGRVVSFDIDELGRVKTRTNKLGAQVLTTTWTWDTAPNGIGLVHTITSPDALQSFSYSARGQLEGIAQTVGGDSFAARRWYDDVGRMKSIDYPQPLGEEPFGVMYERDEHGFVVGMREKNTNESFWALKEVDDAGRIQKERFSNGVETTRDYYDDKQTLKSISTSVGSTKIQDLSYKWNERLNLKSRTDALQLQNKTERFRYDELNRVTCAYFSSIENDFAPCASSYSYMANGNLWSKSDVGTYSYDPKHPHAVTNVPGETFVYDAVGNQIARPGLISITYTPFDLPKTITQGAKTISFGYDGEQQRVRKTTPNAETLYFSDIFEQVTSSAGVVERRFYVHSPERAIAVITRGGATPGAAYFHIDHLGSIETITTEDGTIAERRSYDAFGGRRNPEWGKPSGTFTSRTTRGFTGHEEDDEFGLVNMRGRIFDARLGRFTTTDPAIADIFDGQSLNRYAYVLNNPLAFLDPTGFEPNEATHNNQTPPRKDQAVIIVQETLVVGTRPQWAPKPDPLDLPPAKEAAEVGAHAPPLDVNTTGNGTQGLSQDTTPTEPARPRGFWEGVGDGAVDLFEHLDEMVPGSTANMVANLRTVVDIYDAYRQGDVIDAVNVVNPMMSVARLGFAIDDRDWYTVGQQTVSVGVAILSIVVARKAVGAGKGPKTTRGPPKAGTRPGMPFTRTGKEAVWQENALENNGVNRCDGCGKEVIRPQRHRAGITPPGNEGHVDHRIPEAIGGSGTPENGDLLCRNCNLNKRDRAE